MSSSAIASRIVSGVGVLQEPPRRVLGTTLASIRTLQQQLKALDKTIAQELPRFANALQCAGPGASLDSDVPPWFSSKVLRAERTSQILKLPRC